MTKYRTFFVIVLAFCLLISCHNESDLREISTQDIQSSRYLCHPDTLGKWSRWAMRTDEGLWEDDETRAINLELICTYGGEDMMNPPFYKVNSMHLTGDTLLITDQAQEALICIDLDGTVLWQYGEEGEGPGHFTYVGPSDSASDWIAV